MTSRFIAGLRLEDGLAHAKALAGQGIETALDHLGENVATVAEAKSAGAAALGTLSGLARLGIDGTVAIKLTQLGLDMSIDECIGNLDPLAALAKQAGTEWKWTWNQRRTLKGLCKSWKPCTSVTEASGP